MPIDQQTLNAAAVNALTTLAALLPSSTSGVTQTPRDEGLEITLGSHGCPDRPLTVYTDSEELTVCFGESHYHIADYFKSLSEADIVEQMILGVIEILTGRTCAYSAFAGDVLLGGGFLEGDRAMDFEWNRWWSTADRIQIFAWDSPTDRVIPRPTTP